jgi:phospholipid N-methyltransferase
MAPGWARIKTLLSLLTRIRMPSQAATKSAARSSSLALSSFALFTRNFFKSPAMLGSVFPSSPFLVNDMMNQVDWDRARVVVEYGPGVGTFTREILKRMRLDAVLVAIELNTDFVEYLSNHVRDPRFRVIHGSAARVRSVLAEQNLAPADYIISGLPYLNMPDSLRREILEESRLALRAEGSMVLFQYTRTLLPYLESRFSSVKLNFQLFNILPALIFHCTR